MRNKITYRFGVINRLRKFADGVKRFWVLYFCGNLIELLLGLILPLFYSIFIEKVILGKRINILLIVVMGYLSVQIMSFAAAYFKNYCHYRMTNRVTVRMKEKIIANYLDHAFVDRKVSPTDAKMVIDDDMIKLTAFADAQSSDYVINLGKMIIISVVLLLIEWRLAIVCIVLVPVTFLLTEMYGRKSGKVQNVSRRNDAKWGDWLYSVISGWREVRAMNLQEKGKEVFRNYSKKDAVYFTKVTNYWVIRNRILPRIKDEFLMQFLVYFIGGVLIYYNQLTIGSLLVFAQYYAILTTSVQEVTHADADLQSNIDFYNRVLDAADEPASDNSEKVKCFDGIDIEVKNIRFQYPKSENFIFKDFSLTIARGERVGIVGESGKGKTTLLNLIAGALSPNKGSVFFGGVNLKDVDLRELHKKIGFILQNNVLFNASICENLKYGKEDITEEDMRIACEKAYIYDFIKSLPDGFDTVIGEDGIRLSGGQKQRLILARLFLKDVDVFIFDEATSALDQHAESVIHDAIREIGENKTIILVSHRKSSLDLCDRIVTL